MLFLPKVTLVAFGSTNKVGMQKALEESCKGIVYGDVKLITQVKCNSIDEWNKNIIYRLWEFIDTDYALLIHPDGYMIESDAWSDDFLDYDYVGSPWPLPQDDFSYRDINGKVQRVGNSVSLRSKRILELPTKMGYPWRSFHGNTNEDGYLCVNMRHALEKDGVRFAPVEVAARFGREHDVPENENVEQTFVFHKHYSPKNVKYKIYE